MTFYFMYKDPPRPRAPVSYSRGTFSRYFDTVSLGNEQLHGRNWGSHSGSESNGHARDNFQAQESTGNLEGRWLQLRGQYPSVL